NPIFLPTRDPCARRLAARLNVQLKELRRQRQRYENGDRELKEAVTNISHDLRTPLTAIQGYLDLLEREEALSPNARRYLDSIH
ncbi:sensor histidine kinase, partial [Klebsiella oxytoca]